MGKWKKKYKELKKKHKKLIWRTSTLEHDLNEQELKMMDLNEEIIKATTKISNIEFYEQLHRSSVNTKSLLKDIHNYKYVMKFKVDNNLMELGKLDSNKDEQVING